VVGAALEEKYPELAGYGAAEMAYTVYLHVGLARSWILQYSLPRAADAAAAGTLLVWRRHGRTLSCGPNWFPAPSTPMR